MELNIFPQPAVAGTLTRNYVEARLHTDSHDDQARPVLQALQLELQGDNSLPFYIAMHPDTREKLVTFNRAGEALLDPQVFLDFLERGIEQAQLRVASADR